MTPQRIRELAAALTTPEGQEIVSAFIALRRRVALTLTCAQSELGHTCEVCSDCAALLEMLLKCTEDSARVIERLG